MLAPTEDQTIAMERFLATEYRPAREYVRGEVRERPTTGGSHERVRKALLRWIIGNEEKLGIDLQVEYFMRVAPDT